MTDTAATARRTPVSAGSQFNRDSVKGALVDEIASRARQGLRVCLAPLALFIVLDWAAGNPRQSELGLIKFAQACAILLAAGALRSPARRRLPVLVVCGLCLAVLYVGTAVSGVMIGDCTTTPLMFSALAIGSASVVPWGLKAQALSLLPCALSAAGLFASRSGAAPPFESSTIAALAVALLVSIFIAAQTEEQRLTRIHFRSAEQALREGAERRAAVIAAALDAIVVVDEAGAVLEFNPAAERIFGIQREAALGRQMLRMLVPERLYDVYAAALAEHLSPEHAGFLGVGVEIPARRSDGGEFAAEFAVARSDWEGLPIRIYQIRDLSVRKRTEHALRESEARLKGFFDSANVLLSLVDLTADDFVFAVPNQRMAEFFGATLEGFTGKSGRQIGFSDQQIDYWMAQARRCLVSGPRRVAAYRFDFAGQTRWLEVSLSPVRGAADEPTQISITAVDVTERKLAEEAVRSLNRELEARVSQRTAQLEFANKELGSFAYAVSHDLRAPLRLIDGFADILMQDHGERLGPDAAADLQRVRQAAKRMAELIDGLLSLSRVARGELRDEAVDLSALAGEVCDELCNRHSQREVQVVVQPGMTTRGDPRLLRVVLENLVGNAFKYTSRNDSARIEIGQTCGDHGREYFVRDDGCGFDDTYADKLFRAFSRLHDPGDYEGNGIGLATVARIVQRHGGRVRAEGAVRRGATFFFSLGGEEIECDEPEALSA